MFEQSSRNVTSFQYLLISPDSKAGANNPEVPEAVQINTSISLQNIKLYVYS